MIVSPPLPIRDVAPRALHSSAFATQLARGTPPRITPTAPSHALPQATHVKVSWQALQSLDARDEPPRARGRGKDRPGRERVPECSSHDVLPRQDSSRVRHEVREATSESLTKIPRRGAAGHDTDGKQEDATQRRERGLPSPGSRCVLTRARVALLLVCCFFVHAGKKRRQSVKK